MSKSQHAPAREKIPTLESLGVELHPETVTYVNDPHALAKALGGSGFFELFKNPLVLAAAVSACLGGLLFGFDQGIVSIVLTMKQFLSQFPETDKTVTSAAGLNKGVMTALLELGAFLGAIQAGFLADKYSRKYAIAFGMIWFVIGSILQASAYHFAQLVVGRFIGGVGIGILSSCAPMYISEISPPNIRGALLVLEAWTIVFGIVVMFYITYATRHIDSDWSFRIPFTVQMAPCVLLAAALWKLPYSPRWLAFKGRDEESLQSLMTLRRLPASDPRVQAEWIAIRAEAVRNREVAVSAHPQYQGDSFSSQLKLEAATWADMFRPKFFRKTQIGIMLMFLQQFVGVNALIYYSPTLFETLGLDSEMQITLSGILNIVQLGAVTIAFFITDRVGRKPILLWGAVGMTISHVVVAAMIGKYQHNWPAYPSQAKVGAAFIFIFMLTYGMGWAPVPWSMPAEIHDSAHRAKGVAITTCSNWFNNFIIGLITPPMIQNISYGTFIFFGAFAVMSIVYTIFFVPETRGKTLEQMDEIFGTHASQDNAIATEEILTIMCGLSQSASQPDSNKREKDLQTEYIERV
ncbi:monosaccharide transporter [Kwoniella mangroviensis CBS 10435]|uniref:Monosaccharide transporter n=1 Tax=Kwoniella mangroviensis CBS 10435 TaxID=1331196 RepID=A0A1B9J0Q0_9TREE|nr:monosaccharide transporter [Kwoniella mangroviensis CBS 10435]OCF77376.1 monosaccharide transporter [Kwoniella mangroviensis CBS 8886]